MLDNLKLKDSDENGQCTETFATSLETEMSKNVGCNNFCSNDHLETHKSVHLMVTFFLRGIGGRCTNNVGLPYFFSNG